jgi:hypothetical protein
MSLAQTLQNFRDTVVSVNGLIVSAHTTDATTGANLWQPDEIVFITESAFLKMFIAWESFLEKSFILYLMGNPSITGRLLTKYASPIDEKHAHEILIGTMRYVDWSNPEIVKKIAKIYFELGEPFENAIASSNHHLLDLRTIRNSSAHISSTTTRSLDALATRLLQRPIAGITIYDLILAIDPQNTSNTILKSYQDILDTVALEIANA